MCFVLIFSPKLFKKNFFFFTRILFRRALAHYAKDNFRHCAFDLCKVIKKKYNWAEDLAYSSSPLPNESNQVGVQMVAEFTEFEPNSEESQIDYQDFDVTQTGKSLLKANPEFDADL